ncbi:hypothetical protein FGG08_003498 [Glutinoglossum americanum]|uniref:Aminodeoxychorismate lyase n=1 Tax=Glutinoglossum americanum TaxID=1670608 RepID=A0A9P8KY04_9PEZI|nr:hypothetical protein FGG08_003498 [Glutinoglossum americanum]
MALEADFSLFSSLRYDPNLLQSTANASVSYISGTPSPFYMLRYHRDRMLSAAEYFRWDMVVSRLKDDAGLKYLNQELETEVKNWFASNGEQESQSLKIRTLFTPTSVLTIELSPVPPVPLENLFPTTLNPSSTLSTPPRAIYLDSCPTPPSPFTSYKTTSRDMYATARSRAGIHSFQEHSEVVLVNPAGELMEGSLTSVYFFRDGKWVTPSVASGGQIGTTRRWLIDKGFCIEGIIEAKSLQDGESCWISNGLRGLILCQYISNLKDHNKTSSREDN